MADLRAELAKQVSQIPRAHTLKASEVRLAPPPLWDQSELLEGPERISIRGADVRISRPRYVAVPTSIPMQIYGRGDGPADPLKIPFPSYDEAASIIPLVAAVTSVELEPPVGAEIGALDLVLDSLTILSREFRLDVQVDTKTIGFAPFSPTKVQMFGRNYADKHWRRIPVPGVEGVARTSSTRSEDRREAVSAERKKRGRKPKPRPEMPSIWDLIFAMLQPPLALYQSANLPFPNPPFPYQWHGIKFLIENDHALLADDMGTGKTVMTIVAIKILIQQAKVHHVLVLCPPSVLYEWKRHLDDWAPDLTSYLIRGPREQRKPLWEAPIHVYVTAYDSLRSDIENRILPRASLSHFDLVVLDEAHHVKNMKSARFRAVKKLKPQRRWALTGTPIQNKIDDLAAIFEFVYPGFLTPYDLYPEALKEKIAGHFMRRRKQEVLPELPPKMYEPIELELDEDQEEAYRQAEAGIRIEFDDALARGQKITKQHIFAKLNLLKQICNFAPGKSTSPKTESLKELIEEIVASGETETLASGNKVIVFSQYVGEGVSKLEKLLTPYGIAKIVGGQSDAVRRGEIEKFKTRKDLSVLIASVRSGGEGLNLTEASYVVHFDHWWNPAVMWQAEDRVHRRGQTRGVNVYSYWMKDTIDDRIREKLREKGLLFEQVVDGLAEEGLDELFTVDEWLDMFGVRQTTATRKPVINPARWQSMSLPEIQEKLYEIPPSAFEALVRDLMHYLGYPNVKVTGKSHDGGIDVISSRNTESGIERVAAQCKRYRTSVPVRAARDFFGAIASDRRIKQGFLVTTGEFTAECLKFCESTGMIRAIAGLELAKYVKQFGLQI